MSIISMDAQTFTPYSGIRTLLHAGDLPSWADELNNARIAAYLKYEEMYWTDERAYQLLRRGVESKPLVIPTAKTVVDSTAHYYMKGMEIVPESMEEGGKVPKEVPDVLDKFMKRERFYSQFHVNKLAGVARGDWVFHLTADPDKPEGKRVSLNLIDPASYFRITDEDDPDKLLGIHIVDQILMEDQKWRIKMLTYRKGGPGADESVPEGRISTEEVIYEMDDKLFSKGPTRYRTVSDKELLPEDVRAIPVYHFKNVDWQGWEYGVSELKGLERIMQGINQGMTDEELTLALEGLGVWWTDGGHPVDKSGNDVDWEISPGRVMEVAAGKKFGRAEGVKTVTPMLDHVNFLDAHTHEAAGNFRPSTIDPQIAASGIALAIRFIPMMAKLEQRDIAATDGMQQFWYDWSFFHSAYEVEDIRGLEVKINLGEKLPVNKVDMLNVYNNLLDRRAISRKFYREQLGELYGIVYPDTIDADIQAEKEADIQMQRETAIATGAFQKAEEKLSSGGRPENKSKNKSNNANRPNESAGTEAGNGARR